MLSSFNSSSKMVSSTIKSCLSALSAIFRNVSRLTSSTFVTSTPMSIQLIKSLTTLLTSEKDLITAAIVIVDLEIFSTKQ